MLPCAAVKRLLAFSRLLDRIADWIGVAAGWLCFAMVLLGAYNAIARYIDRGGSTHLSSNAFIEGQWYLFSAVFLLGATYALRKGSHVRVDLIYMRLSLKARAWLDLIGTAIFLIPFCLFVWWVSYPAIAKSWTISEQSPDPGGLPRYPIKALLLVALVLLLAQSASELIKRLAVVTGHAAGDDE
jgi:TRAP-type mannitol/chloroaromatic compound transport system permease small subunit